MFLATDSELAGPKAKSSRFDQYDQLVVPLRNHHKTTLRRFLSVGFHVKHLSVIQWQPRRSKRLSENCYSS